MPIQDGEPVPLVSARDWAESYQPFYPLPPLVVRRRVGPGWLDDETPCACEAVFLMQLGRELSSWRIEDLISRPLYSGGVCTFDPRDLSTKVQK